MCAYSMSVILERVGSTCTTFVYQWWPIETYASGSEYWELQGMWGGVCQYILLAFLFACYEDFPTHESPMQLVIQGRILGCKGQGKSSQVT